MLIRQKNCLICCHVIYTVGAVIPLGGLVEVPAPEGKSTVISNNEFIIHSEAQCALRYIIQFRKC